jgi:hypothetical protein
MKIGDKVKHINTGDHIHEIIRFHGNIATIKRPPELWVKLNPNSKSSLIIDLSICKTENLILCKDKT